MHPRWLPLVAALFAVALAACGRPPDAALAARLRDVMYYYDRPEWHGDALARVSRELPKYERYMRDWMPSRLPSGQKKFPVRATLAGVYAYWHYDAESLSLVRAGLESRQDTIDCSHLLVYQGALFGDAAMLEAGWKHFKADLIPLVSKGPLEAIVRGDLAGGAILALDELNRWEDIRGRMILREFLARVLAINASALRAAGLEERVLQAQFIDFLRGGSWADFLARLPAEKHDRVHTVTVGYLISTMGSAAEYYARLGDRARLEEWAERMTALRAAAGKDDAARLDYFLEAARKIASSDTARP